MQVNIANQSQVLAQMPVGALREKYAEIFKEQSRSYNRDYLTRRILWQMQSLSEGDLSERAKARGMELTRDSDIRVHAPGTVAGSASAQSSPTFTLTRPASYSPMPGTILTRQYRGELIQVIVLEKGFEHQGKFYRSLSAVAKEITGSHWNGRAFFGLAGKESN